MDLDQKNNPENDRRTKLFSRIEKIPITESSCADSSAENCFFFSCVREPIRRDIEFDFHSLFVWTIVFFLIGVAVCVFMAFLFFLVHLNS